MPSNYDHQLARFRHRFLEKKYNSCGLQKPDSYYLVMIARFQSLKLSRLIRESPFHKSHATRTINRLVNQGFITKTIDPEDHRGYVVSATSKGKTTAQRVEAFHREWQDLMEAPLSETELETVSKIKEKVLAYLENHFKEED
ncbi:MAG: MarR family winged helix-turn-helix transcriptional regulator [Candidatus Izemoplasmatales bacterium]|jgi:DNA-binding MarR family transcriptional regulator|nr:winged helix-turn-helix transcriptional regulator [Acholeplasmataceae bacterium]